MKSIEDHLEGGLIAGIIVGMVCYWAVRPTAKSSTATQMAHRWMAWGLMGGVSVGIPYLYRHGDTNGLAGLLLGICFFSLTGWGLGFVWGWIKFQLFPNMNLISYAVENERLNFLGKLPDIRSAAERGQAYEQYLLGLSYFSGEGIVKNQVEAYKWMLLAQANGEMKARRLVQKMEKVLSRSEIAEGQKLASEMQSDENL
jgi:hypothetical protein